MNLVTVGGIILKLLPIIIDGVRKLEEADNSPNKGAEKREAVIGIIRGIYETDPTPPVPFDKLVDAITKVINTVVAYYNAVGIFIKKSKA